MIRGVRGQASPPERVCVTAEGDFSFLCPFCPSFQAGESKDTLSKDLKRKREREGREVSPNFSSVCIGIWWSFP